MHMDKEVADKCIDHIPSLATRKRAQAMTICVLILRSNPRKT